MNTLKKFISYYRPYRAVFYFDLFCAAVISVVDLAYPQLLRSLTKTLFTGNKSAILGALPWLFLIFTHYVYHTKPVQILRHLPGTHYGSENGTRYAKTAF